jgi:hypothetical protein
MCAQVRACVCTIIRPPYLQRWILAVTVYSITNASAQHQEHTQRGTGVLFHRRHNVTITFSTDKDLMTISSRVHKMTAISAHVRARNILASL